MSELAKEANLTALADIKEIRRSDIWPGSHTYPPRKKAVLTAEAAEGAELKLLNSAASATGPFASCFRQEITHMQCRSSRNPRQLRDHRHHGHESLPAHRFLMMS